MCRLFGLPRGGVKGAVGSRNYLQALEQINKHLEWANAAFAWGSVLMKLASHIIFSSCGGTPYRFMNWGSSGSSKLPACLVLLGMW